MTHNASKCPFLKKAPGGSRWLSIVSIKEGLRMYLKQKREREERREKQTFQMKQHVGLIVFEHLRNKLDIHVLDINLLMWMSASPDPLAFIIFVAQRTCRSLFNTMTASLSFSWFFG